MKLEIKRRVAALIGLPIAYLFRFLDKTEEEKRYTKEHLDLFLDRIKGKRLN